MFNGLVFGEVGHLVVIAACASAVLLQIGGIVLWWKRRRLAVRTNRGWWSAAMDLHHPVGIVTVIPMLILSVTAVGMFLMSSRDFAYPAVRRAMIGLHTGEEYNLAVKAVYFVAALAFAVQGATGFLMWWKQRIAGRLAAERVSADLEAD